MQPVPANAVRLWSSETPHKPDDQRAKPGGPLLAGDIVTLSVHTDHGRGPGWKFEYVKVRVTAVEGEQYRGEVIDEVHPALIAPEKLARGSIVAFTLEHVVAIAEPGGPNGYPCGEF